MKAVIRRQDIPGLIMLVLFGIGLTFLGIIRFKETAEAQRWPVTKGTITNSNVSGVMKYYPSVTYKYIIDSTVYSSSRISNISFNSKNISAVEDYLKKYQLGSEVKVYYNGSDPSMAFLEPSINTGHIILLAFGILLIAIPFVIIIFFKLDLKKGS